MTPPVSVGLPVYNGERYLRKALDSLLQQDFTDFELVISDNDSTDGTSDICKAYADQDRRIRYYRNQSNIGAGPNYRRVFELSHGNAFMWHAHDNIFKPGFLRHCVDALASAPSHVVMVHTLCEFINESGEVTSRSRHDMQSDARRPFRRIARVVRRGGFEAPLWGLIRADQLRRTKLTGSVSYWDELLVAELTLYGELREIPELLYQVRSHRDNAVARSGMDGSGAVLTHLNKASRTARKALLVWSDPSQAAERVWLPIHLEHCWEYFKRVHSAPLTLGDKVLCYVTIPSIYFWGVFKNWGGRWKRRILRRNH